MILAEQQMYPLARQCQKEAEAAAAAYRLRRQLGRNTIGPVNTVSTVVRSGVGTTLIRLGRWVAPTDRRQPAGPVLNTI